QGRREITKSDIRAAARLALPHRRRRNPFDAPGLDEELLDQLLDEEPDPDPTPPDGGPPNGPSNDSSHKEMRPEPVDGSAVNAVQGDREFEPVNGPSTSSGHTQAAERIASAGDAYRTRLFAAPGVGLGEAGRRSRALTSVGHKVGAVPASGNPGGLHL